MDQVMSTVLVGLDGSMASRIAFREAVREAEWRDATLCVFHVVFVPMVLGKSLNLTTTEELESYGHYIVDSELSLLADEYDGEFPVTIERCVRAGHMGEELLRASNDPDRAVELVVLGARGLGGFSSLMLGSLTTYAVHHLVRPLLVVPVLETEAE